jgi:hypothetical protein
MLHCTRTWQRYLLASSRISTDKETSTTFTNLSSYSPAQAHSWDPHIPGMTGPTSNEVKSNISRQIVQSHRVPCPFDGDDRACEPEARLFYDRGGTRSSCSASHNPGEEIEGSRKAYQVVREIPDDGVRRAGFFPAIFFLSPGSRSLRRLTSRRRRRKRNRVFFFSIAEGNGGNGETFALPFSPLRNTFRSQFTERSRDDTWKTASGLGRLNVPGPSVAAENTTCFFPFC